MSEADAVAGVAVAGQNETVVGPGAGGFTTTVAVADLVASATLVAFTATVC